MTCSRKVVTRGYSAFSWYVRVSMALAVLAMAPLIILYLVLDALTEAVRRNSQRGRDVSVVKRDCILKSSLGRLFGHSAAQFFAYWHAFASNMLFFTLLTAAVLKIVSTEMTASAVLKSAALVSLGPSCILAVMSMAYYCLSSFLQSSGWFLMGCCAGQRVHGYGARRDVLEDSVLDLMLRDQVGNYSSMSSLSRLDKQLLFGVPTMLVAISCYEYDRCTGQEREVRDAREQCRDRLGRGSTQPREGVWL